MKEYKFLKVACNIFKVLAWIALSLGVIVGIIIFITGGGAIAPMAPGGATPPATPKSAGVVFLIMGAFYFLILYSLSEVIGLLLDIKSSSEKPV